MPKIDVSEQMRAVFFSFVYKFQIRSFLIYFRDTVTKTLDPHLFQT